MFLKSLRFNFYIVYYVLFYKGIWDKCNLILKYLDIIFNKLNSC